MCDNAVDGEQPEANGRPPRTPVSESWCCVNVWWRMTLKICEKIAHPAER
ncbi:hypothetical protein HMPREF9622_00513 [Cutibacterium modestum HL037PA3]|uniref:Uncharacterized protein n=1 Tax=Cutibacterium modestum HL044PA1 TaxID=765109 RepID=A0ABN0C8Q4_9ACTN|nr:hypothetical protein HMPREF9621_01195 [Cutibacterium modestum HL037PA2]EFS93613.1 hypothetical protein HMPREF9607_00067 [Cutibacterium modestum HL044PA1]EFT16308.1 hypothetical protein HMPREF9622_00513 [Cutibacterium modestum HL037PA3]